MTLVYYRRNICFKHIFSKWLPLPCLLNKCVKGVLRRDASVSVTGHNVPAAAVQMGKYPAATHFNAAVPVPVLCSLIVSVLVKNLEWSIFERSRSKYVTVTKVSF